MDLMTISATVIPIGALLSWIWSRIDKKFDAIDKKFEMIFQELKDIRKDIAGLDSRLNRLEVRVEERTLRVVHVQKQFSDPETIKEN